MTKWQENKTAKVQKGNVGDFGLLGTDSAAPRDEPKVVTVVSMKGGSGKTALVALLASAAASMGLRVHLLDADRNPQLLEWRGSMEAFDWGGLPIPKWPDQITADRLAGDLEGIADQIDQKKSDADLILIDTRPGSYEDTEDVAYMSDVILIPSSLAPGEVKWAVDTFLWMMRCKEAFADEPDHPPVRLALSNMSKQAIDAFSSGSPDLLTEMEYQQMKEIIDLPALGKPIPNSKVIENMPVAGPLNAQFEAAPSRRHHLARLLSVGQSLVQEVLNLEREA